MHSGERLEIRGNDPSAHQVRFAGWKSQGCIYGCRDRNQSEANQKHSEPEISKLLKHIQPYPNFEFFVYLGWFIWMVKISLHKPFYVHTYVMATIVTTSKLYSLFYSASYLSLRKNILWSELWSLDFFAFIQLDSWPYFAKLHFKKGHANPLLIFWTMKWKSVFEIYRSLKSTQYKKFAPNTLRFPYCKPQEKKQKTSIYWWKTKKRVWCPWFYIFHVIYKISNFW